MAQGFHTSLTWYEAGTTRAAYDQLFGPLSADVIALGQLGRAGMQGAYWWMQPMMVSAKG
jgi:hypothetical protein